MTSDEWKEELNNQCAGVLHAYNSLASHITELPSVSDAKQIDFEELAAVMLVKLTKMNRKAEELFN